MVTKSVVLETVKRVTQLFIRVLNGFLIQTRVVNVFLSYSLVIRVFSQEMETY